MLRALPRFILLLCLCTVSLWRPALAFDAPPFQGDVLDEVGLLTQGDTATLLQRIKDLRENAGIWAAIYVAKGLQGDSIENAAVATFEKWKLGAADVDNGLLILIVPSERRMRIEVGYGLEGPLTDALSKHVIDDIYKPAFRERRYTEGLMQGFDVMARAVRGEAPAVDTVPSAAPASPPDADEIHWERFVWPFLAAVGVNLLPAPLYALATRYGRSRGRSNVGATGRETRSAFTVFGFFGVFFGLFFAVFGLAFDSDTEAMGFIVFMNALFLLAFGTPFFLIARRYLSASAYRRWQARQRLLRIRKRSKEARPIFGVWFDPDKVTVSSGGTKPEPRSSSSSSSSWGSSSSSSSGGGRSGGGGASGSW
jgi:uncharacterized protein